MAQAELKQGLATTITVADYLKQQHIIPRSPIVAAKVNNLLKPLTAEIDPEQDKIEFVDLTSDEGLHIYRRITGRREWTGNKLQLKPRQVLIIEGIHGLNERLTALVPSSQKIKIYVSALTHVNIDKTNQIHSSDIRLLRRICRDAQFRGSPAARTIAMWPSVRRGEERNIFPFQEEADFVFNSGLVYELAVLKNLAEPLLKQITPDQAEYSEAVRLLEFLRYFLAAPADVVPNNSVLREFIGGCCFYH